VSIKDELIRVRQAAEMLSLCGYYHLHKLAANRIDGEEGVMEQRVGQLLGRRCLEHLGFDVRLEGLENFRHLDKYAVVSTHASHLDWAMLLGYCPDTVRFIARADLVKVPVIGDYLKLRGILIDRAKGINAKVAIRAAARDDSPIPILIFPEGTRTRDGELQPFRRGGLRILAEEGLAMVPVCITGTFDAFSRDATYIKRGGRLRMQVGAPVHADPDLGVEGQLEEIEARVQALFEATRGDERY
jgi:1-acyl-sn-glycerol-3-phosphate acyltransferase